MTTEQKIADLELKIHRALDKLHDELLAKLRSMAKSTGQRTRVDRLK